MHILNPNWPAIKNIVAFTTLRNCDLSKLNLPSDIAWLDQQHGRNILNIDPRYKSNGSDQPIADGSYTMQPNYACVVKTADCLPILIAHSDGIFVAALHAGWKGLAAGIIEQFFKEISKINLDLNKLQFWLGPAIGTDQFEVGEDVVQKFSHNNLFRSAFVKIKSNSDKYLANIYQLASIDLNYYGINNQQIFSHYYCTYSDPNKFYSYRGNAQDNQRMYSFIWIK